jgi:hypothetical protein
MDKHLQNRLEDQKSKLDHWVWKWVGTNLPRVAALLVFAGHMLPDVVLSCSASTDCLLQKASESEDCMFWKVNIESQDEWSEGLYLYYNQVRGLWVRSGKTTGKN